MITSTAAIATLVLSICLVVIPRKYLLVPFIAATCFIPTDQRVIIADLDFTVLRFCVLFGVLRLLVRGEAVRIHWNTFDKILLFWAVCGAIIYVLQWCNLQAVIYKAGSLLDCLGLYWIFRQNIRSWRDIDLLVKVFAVFAAMSASLAIVERITHINPFIYLGTVITLGVHRGRFRCCGVFGNPIILGLFWASLIPWFLGYIKAKRNIIINVIAVISCLLCVTLSGSSTPVLTVAAILFFFVLYRYRAYGRQIVLGLCCLILALHLYRQRPVWHLISRVSVFSGSTGWHRYHLIDQAIKHFSEWMLLGTRDTVHWGWGLQDITNQYVFVGVLGGGVSLLIFIILLIYAVKIPGTFSLHCDNKYRWLSWGICVSVLGHCVSFFGVSYFGSILMLLYFTFAIVGFIAEKSRTSSLQTNLLTAR